MVDRKLSLTFFFPYRDISGVPVLFIRMAEFLATKRGIETCIVDYYDGYMAVTLRDRNSPVKLRYFEDNHPFVIGPETILVMQSILPNTMKKELIIDPDTRIIFWTFYHLNFVQTIIPLPFFCHLQTRYIAFHKLFMNTLMISLKRKLQKLVETMQDKKSLFFQDGSVMRYTKERLDIQIDSPIYVPVPCDDIPRNQKKTRASENKKSFSFCWVGRIADFKTHILSYTIKRLSELCLNKNLSIEFYVVGEGPDEPIIKALKAEHNNFRLTFKGVIAGKMLDSFLVERIDVLTAMGTSALEGAKLGVPTILLDASYGPVNGDYKFNWLFESKEFIVGEQISSRHFEHGNKSLEIMINDVRENYVELSNKTFEYCLKNHSISTVSQKFLNNIELASFRYSDFEPGVLRKGLIRRTYEHAREYK